MDEWINFAINNADGYSVGDVVGGIVEYTGAIVQLKDYCTEEDIDNDEAVDILGEITAYVIDNTASETEADEYSGSLLEIVEFINKEEDSPENFFDDIMGIGNTLYDIMGIGNTLYVESIEIKPAYRGKGLGLKALYTTCQILGKGCSKVLIIPCPLENLKSNGRKRLQKYWSLLGFSRIRRSGMFYFDLACEMPRPWQSNSVCAKMNEGV